MMTDRHTDAQVEAAIENVSKILDAAENSNHAGEVAIVRLNNGRDEIEQMRLLLKEASEHIRYGSSTSCSMQRILDKIDAALESGK